jgi:hypothetical protein
MLEIEISASEVLLIARKFHHSQHCNVALAEEGRCFTAIMAVAIPWLLIIWID